MTSFAICILQNSAERFATLSASLRATLAAIKNHRALLAKPINWHKGDERRSMNDLWKSRLVTNADRIYASPIYHQYQSVDPEMKSQWIFRVCGYRLMRAFAHQRIIDRFIVSSVARENFRFFKEPIHRFGDYIRRVRQLRIDLARADRCATKTGDVYISSRVQKPAGTQFQS